MELTELTKKEYKMRMRLLLAVSFKAARTGGHGILVSYRVHEDSERDQVG